jgi:hypothetical protein
MRFCALRVNSNAMDKGKPLACLAFLLHHPGDALYSHPILEGHTLSEQAKRWLITMARES